MPTARIKRSVAHALQLCGESTAEGRLAGARGADLAQKAPFFIVPFSVHPVYVERQLPSGRDPVPALAAAVAIFMEVPVAIAIVVGVFTRPSAILLAFYTLGAALIAHHYWTMTGAAQLDNMIHFYKNVSIMGGFLLLYVTGPGKYSVDAKFGMPEAEKDW
jgi:uncharacterized membrane protein YphA (DoxX/SURF4 family)